MSTGIALRALTDDVHGFMKFMAHNFCILLLDRSRRKSGVRIKEYKVSTLSDHIHINHLFWLKNLSLLCYNKASLRWLAAHCKCNALGKWSSLSEV